MDREAWHAEIHGVAQSQTWLSDWAELKYYQFPYQGSNQCAFPSIPSESSCLFPLTRRQCMIKLKKNLCHYNHEKKKMLWWWFQEHFPNCGWVLLVLSEAMLATSVKYGEAWVAFFPFMVDFIIWMSENNLNFREFHCGPVIRAQRFHGPGHRFDPCSEN